MNPPKRNIPEIVKEVRLKEVVAMKPLRKESIQAKFDDTQKAVLDDLLFYMLDREPLSRDFGLINLVEYTGEETGNYVYFCDVRIGRLITGGPNNFLESMLELKDIFIYFYPDEEYKD